MTELDKTKIASQSTPLWGRLLVNTLGAIFAYIVTFALVFEFLPPGIFVYFIFLSTLAIALVLPHIPYKQSNNWISVTCLLLVVWIMILLVATPTFTKQYYLTQSSKIIPAYSAAKLGRGAYRVFGTFGLGKSVDYQYQTKTPSQDYVKMRDLYKSQLDQEGYNVTETTDTSITFQSHNHTNTTISLSISKRHPDTIEVSTDPGDPSCAYFLLFGEFKMFIQCQRGLLD